MEDSPPWRARAPLFQALGLGPGRRVLVVEDDETVRGKLVEALDGCEVDARAGVERDELPLEGYDVAFLDRRFRSATLDGVDLTRALRRSCPRVRILAMSGDEAANAEMLRLGANLALAKPALRRLL